MKKGVIIGLVLVVILAGVIFFFNSESSEDSDVNEVTDVGEVENVQGVEEVIEEIPADPVIEDDSFEIFNPVLTYEGAYNGPLYATSEQVGSASMDSYFQNLDRNGINFFIGMFAISGEPSHGKLVSDSGLGEVIDAAQRHPKRIIPFFNPGIGGEEVEQYLGDELTSMYSESLIASKKIVGNEFIRGFGEVETQEWSARHDDAKVLQLVNLARNNNINFMFHPVANKIDDVRELVEAYPDTIFLIHMYREDLDDSRSELIEIMKSHDNLYYSIDAAHIMFDDGDIIYEYDGSDRENSISKFVSAYDSMEDSFVKEAIKDYKPLVDAVPDKVMWGTEIGPAYAFDREVFDRAVKVSRLVIAGFNPEHQEGVGYKNALRVFGEGVVAPDVEVIDTRSWPDCTDDEMSECDDECEIPDGDDLTAEEENCFLECLIEKECKEVVEMDVG